MLLSLQLCDTECVTDPRTRMPKCVADTTVQHWPDCCPYSVFADTAATQNKGGGTAGYIQDIVGTLTCDGSKPFFCGESAAATTSVVRLQCCASFERSHVGTVCAVAAINDRCRLQRQW